MTKNFSRIDFLFSVTGLFVLLVGLIFFRSAFDINVHDTYFVIANSHITIGLTFLFFIFSLIYFSFARLGRPLKKGLGLTHYIITVLTLFITVFPPTFLFKPTRYSPADASLDSNFDVNTLILLVFFTFILGQLLFLINIIWTLIRSKKTTP